LDIEMIEAHETVVTHFVEVRGRCFTVVDLLFSISIFEEQNDPSDREVLW